MMALRVSVQLEPEKIKGSLGLGPGGRVQKALCRSALRRCGAYVPLDTGALRASGAVAGDGSAITYTMPYAAAQYHLPYHHAEAQRGRYWDRRMMAAEGAAVAEDGKKAMKGGTD